MTPVLQRRGRRAFAALVVLPALLGLAGCLNWQAAYDESARNECRSIPDISERQACFDRAADNSREKRAEHRGD